MDSRIFVYFWFIVRSLSIGYLFIFLKCIYYMYVQSSRCTLYNLHVRLQTAKCR
ncbi:hypothetical protein BD770DRAFT_380758 [Pilaira anomala]|nr:hypothetical protein BD770DRAFT_380758 [Pilaira anomala]